MDVREKLVELLKKAKAKEQYDFLFGDIDTAIDMPHGAEYYADFLIANDVTVQEWIPVTERLPEQYMSVIVWTSDRERGEAEYDGKQFRWAYDDDYANVTHWMPLPQPPKGE